MSDESLHPAVPFTEFTGNRGKLGCVAKTGAAGGRVRDSVWKALISRSKSNPFRWRHYEPEIIVLCVRWYLTYPLSYRQVAEVVNERGSDGNYTTVFRWVQAYAPELEKRLPTTSPLHQ